MRRVLSTMRRMDKKFGLIEDGDQIAIGLSGGKDSMVLLHALNLYRYYSQKSYTLRAICVDLGFDGFDGNGIARHAFTQNVPCDVVKTNIGHIVFDIRKEKNPCALCAKLRRGALYSRAVQMGCNKAAYAHHLDDAIDTLMMSMMYEARMATLDPKTYLSRKEITLIRPLMFARESYVIAARDAEGIPTFINPCPASGQTKRGQCREIAKYLNTLHGNASKNMKTALQDVDAYSLWNDTEK